MNYTKIQSIVTSSLESKAFLRMFHMKFGFECQAVSEEKNFDILDDRRRTEAEAWPSYKLIFLAFGPGELKMRTLVVERLASASSTTCKSEYLRNVKLPWDSIPIKVTLTSAYCET